MLAWKDIVIFSFLASLRMLTVKECSYSDSGYFRVIRVVCMYWLHCMDNVVLCKNMYPGIEQP